MVTNPRRVRTLAHGCAVVLLMGYAHAQETEVKSGGATPVATANPALTIIDAAGKTHALTAADLDKLPMRKARLPGDPAAPEYAGVSLVDALKHMGVEFGEALRGQRTPTVVLCEATDRYRIALSLLEIDPATTDQSALLAYSRPEKPLADGEGAFRLIFPDDKRRVRCIRLLQTIRVINMQEVPITPEVDTRATPP